jgi:DNA-binding transcriptional ArsR family regulator
MKEGPDIAALASLIGDPARANMLMALMSGMALTAGELAREANITPQTASAHLSRLLDARLILVEIQGRHRYFRLAGSDVAGALEGLMELAARSGLNRTRPGPRDVAMRMARSCYDHLAGTLGVRLHEALVEQGTLIATADGLGLSEAGRRHFLAEGIDVPALALKGRPLCRACLDWSERRHHLAGPLGAALLGLILDRGWAKRDTRSRAILFSREGERRFEAFICQSDVTEQSKRVSSV